MLCVHVQKRLTAAVFRTCQHISCMQDKDYYLKMAHKGSQRSQKYLKKYQRERGVPLHNERVAELSQLTDRAEILQLPILQTPDDVDRCKAKELWMGTCYPTPKLVKIRTCELPMSGL